MTGIMDHPILADETNTDLPELLEELRNVVVETNKEWAARLGVNQSTATTAVKPSGTVSQLVNSASGIHPRFSPYYIRTVRGDKKDPMSQFMKEQGVMCEDDVINPSNYVFSFPQKAPDNAVCTDDVGAMRQLKLWKIYQDHWCEHKPSITVYYRDEEFLEVGAWLYKHFDSVSGVSFLPRSEHTYAQAPYQDITEEQYEKLSAEMPDINWGLLATYEDDDNTEGSQTLACTGNNCEL